MSYAIQVRSRETKEWATVLQGKADSRRKFLQANGQSKRVRNEFGVGYWSELAGKLLELVKTKVQWRCVKQ
jgi:hypothetical protein